MIMEWLWFYLGQARQYVLTIRLRTKTAQLSLSDMAACFTRLLLKDKMCIMQYIITTKLH